MASALVLADDNVVQPLEVLSADHDQPGMDGTVRPQSSWLQAISPDQHFDSEEGEISIWGLPPGERIGAPPLICR